MFTKGFTNTANTYPMIIMVDTTASFPPKFLHCNNTVKRKNKLQMKAMRDKNNSQRMNDFTVK